MTKNLNICYWAETDAERVEFYRNLPESELVDIVRDGSHVEDVPAALSELKARGCQGTRNLAQEIIDLNKGDSFLRDWVKEFLCE